MVHVTDHRDMVEDHGLQLPNRSLGTRAARGLCEPSRQSSASTSSEEETWPLRPREARPTAGLIGEECRERGGKVGGEGNTNSVKQHPTLQI